MRLNAAQLPQALARGLKGVYLIAGDEPLLVSEAADAVRAAARAAGFSERTMHVIERGFDWDALRTEIASPSLFAERRLLELRLPSGKPDRGAALLEQLAGTTPHDLMIIVVSGRLDRKASEAAWVRAIEQHGVLVAVSGVERGALPAWLAQRARAQGIELEERAAQFLTARVEGNLLAARQELEKLALLVPQGRVSLEVALASVGDSARYDVLQLGEAAAAGDAARALRVFAGLKNEGVEPTLVLWALIRELRGLKLARDRAAPTLGWNLAARPTARALARAARLPLEALMCQAARADRIVKGIERGDAWGALLGLTGALAGALQAVPESGRVAT